MKSFILVVALLLVSMTSAVMAQVQNIDVSACFNTYPGWEEYMELGGTIQVEWYTEEGCYYFSILSPLNPNMPEGLLNCIREVILGTRGCCDPNNPNWPIYNYRVSYRWDCCDFTNRWGHHIPSGCNILITRAEIWDCDNGFVVGYSIEGQGICTGNPACPACQ